MDVTQNLVGYAVLQSWKSGRGKRPHSSPFFIDVKLPSSVPPHQCGSFLSLHGVIIALFKSAERWSMCKMVNHIRFLHSCHFVFIFLLLGVQSKYVLCNQQLVVFVLGACLWDFCYMAFVVKQTRFLEMNA